MQIMVGNAQYQCSCVHYVQPNVIEMIVGQSVAVAVIIVIIIIIIDITYIRCRRRRQPTVVAETQSKYETMTAKKDETEDGHYNVMSTISEEHYSKHLSVSDDVSHV